MVSKRYAKLSSIAACCFLAAIFLLSVSPLANNVDSTPKRTHQSEMERINNIIKDTSKGFKATLPEIRLKGNKDSNNIKPIKEMEGFLDADKLAKVNAKVLEEELLTYDKFLQMHTEFGFDPSIEANRMLWVRKVEYPKGVYTMRGFIINAVVTYCYDAETGDCLGYNVISLDKDGMKNLESPFNEDQ